MSSGTATAPYSVKVFIAVIATAILLNYVDRGLLGIAGPLIKDELSLSATQFGLAVSAFFWVYAPIHLLIGRLCDRLPVYTVFASGVALWAASTFLTAFVVGLLSLVLLRVFLGTGESVAFPGSSKMIARHVPAAKRGIANSAVGAALAFGPAIGTFVGGLIAAFYGWRAMFFVFGLLTFVWLFAWKQVIERLKPSTPTWADDCVPIPKVLRQFSLWAMVLAQMTYNYGFYFLLAWLPLFLVKQHGLSIEHMTYLASLAYLSQGASALFFGWASDRWSAAGRNEGSIRRAMLAGGIGLLAVSIVGILYADVGSWLVLWLLLAGIGNGTSTVNFFSIAQIFAGDRAAGTWVGVQNGLANVTGIIGPIITGIIIDWTGSYAGAFWLAAAITLISALLWAVVLPPIKAIQFD